MRKKTPRSICLEILNRAEKADRHADDLLTDSFKRYRHLSSVDRAFLTELAYGVLRWRAKLDWVIGRFSAVPFEKIELEILNVLRLGLYQILFLTKTPVTAAVNESAELAKRFRGKGGAGFVNAILRSILRQKERISFPEIGENPALHISVVQSHPLWLVRRWIDEVGVEETQAICMADNRRAPLILRTNTLKLGREKLIERFAGQGLKPSPTIFSEEGILLEDPPPTSELPFMKDGLYMLQDEASQLVVSILDPQPGERILDGCAAPGTKTTHMAQRMGDEGEVYALDLYREKLNRMEEMCGRLGVKIVKVMKADARQALPFFKASEFDRVLADVPCSGFGTLRRNPDLRWKRGEEDIRRLSELQFAILKNLSGYVREKGVLVYSTCTVFHEENEDVVERFLSQRPEFHLDQVSNVLPAKCHAFVRNGFFKTFPRGDGMDGFFVARLIKAG